ncbi:DNA-binding transcriptional MocR family regulator [Catenuloplanes nepalensis]|uniref:DNA-binding transcriptional MocR family regulator n=1 Tax=Catenuloplanes nepalensis TaxID=587533 RepID=A0ABT9N5S8_9ACTN|nr:PLP-dependent aminotransferase family protein [Catenuloplanes nepalensis]MDP9799058.1 DNA-binding transcriptional MocR family regulator [Catenuloplanes nepalensis]
MKDDNAAAGVIQDLRQRVAAAPPGARLPPVRELIARHRVSPLTVQAAIRRLASEGLVESRPGSGTFVLAAPAGPVGDDLGWQAVALGERPGGEDAMQELLSLPRPGAIPLSGGYLDAELAPTAALGAALARAARRPASWDRGPVEGRADLRAWFARQTGSALRAEDMSICPGGQSALATAFRALAGPGDVVLVDAPTYLGAIAAARAAGLRVVPVPSDAQGVRPELLEAAFARTGARLYYCQPLYANPHGATLGPRRRADVLAAVRRAGAFLIEDDYARDLVIDGDPPPPLAAADPGGHVVYLRSLTKAAAAGLRVATIGARGAAGARLRAVRVLDDFFVAGPLQEAALDFVTSPAWARHRRTLRLHLRQRRDALVAALHRELPVEARTLAVPAGGLHLWWRLPDGVDDTALAAEALARDVVVSPGRPWFAAEPDGPHLRLTFALAAPAQLAEGASRLAAALRAMTSIH